MNRLIGLFLIMLLSACSPQPSPIIGTAEAAPTLLQTAAPITAEQRGQVVFFGVGGCISCHTITGAGGRVGPDLKGIVARIAFEKPDVDVRTYLHEGIVDVLAVVDPPWRDDLMPRNYADTLNAGQVTDLVAYMMALE